MDKDAALKKLQAEELDILLVVRDFCEKHQIEWVIDSGTALGAARHKGFIPWDDDIDISMPRCEYERFVRLAKEGGLPDGYSFHDHVNTKGVACFFGKVSKDGTEFVNEEASTAGYAQGIYIDVFPHDTLKNDERARGKQIRNASKWQKLSYLYHTSHIVVPHKGVTGMLERLACKLAHAALKGLYSSREEHLWYCFARSIDGTKPEAGVLIKDLSYDGDPVLAYEDVYPAVPAEFEGHMFPAPCHLDKYLTQAYGDWRAMPKAEDRHTHLPLRLAFSDGEVWEAEAGE